jgi:hypothetical protein
MNSQDFYNDIEVSGFVEWLSAELEHLTFGLSIGKSAKAPYGVNAKVIGINDVIKKYQWKASWLDDSTGASITSCGWDTTAKSLNLLSEKLKQALLSNDAETAFKACTYVFSWGGERNPQTGARKFLVEKLDKGELVDYLKEAQATFSLKSANLTNLEPIELVNSMLTKVYALQSDDGLPIYDTRVAVAIAGLVEIYRLKTRQPWVKVPDLLAFPVPPEDAKSQRRRVKYLNPNALAPKPEMLSYISKKTPMQWASAKVRLGWIITEVLKRNPTLLSNQEHSRHHAFEAALFMIGYDVRSLSANLP